MNNFFIHPFSIHSLSSLLFMLSFLSLFCLHPLLSLLYLRFPSFCVTVFPSFPYVAFLPSFPTSTSLPHPRILPFFRFFPQFTLLSLFSLPSLFSPPTLFSLFFLPPLLLQVKNKMYLFQVKLEEGGGEEEPSRSLSMYSFR